REIAAAKMVSFIDLSFVSCSRHCAVPFHLACGPCSQFALAQTHDKKGCRAIGAVSEVVRNSVWLRWTDR
ncbi:hypothetical protein, partial [Mesorhizobium sp.]|uniref:hypothetical protein n=1 Tax=Mesorhizobium sp. TaxID=1871066 RepID=UPI0025EA4A30